jgi:hypothetical protein
MKNPLSLDNILATLEATSAPAVKTAGVAAPVATLEADMLASVQALTAKTAEAASPAAAPTDAITALHKIASETAAAEGVMLQKTAELAGAAMCDGFMARLAGYDTATSKTAGVAGAYTEEHLKLAYAQGMEDMQKTADAEFTQGAEDAFAQIHKTAAEVHLAGQQSARNVLLALEAAG